MKLLILTQKVDRKDSVLGFMHRWIEAFAASTEKVTVICLEAGEYDLPENVTVYSLGKEQKASRLSYLVRFFKYIIALRGDYDTVLVHMNTEYVVLGGAFWRMWGKRIGLWYAHGEVSLRLRAALHFVHAALTSTPGGLRIASPKVHVIGQGIDTDMFAPLSDAPTTSEVLRIITVGRISPVKDYETLIGATKILCDRGIKVAISIIGEAGLPEQVSYLASLKETVLRLGLEKIVSFQGARANKDLPQELGAADVFVNMGRTGSLDKALLEAMASGVPVVTSNEALRDILGPYASELMFATGDRSGFAAILEKIAGFTAAQRKELGGNLREIVVRDHSLHRFIEKVLGILRGASPVSVSEKTLLS